MRGPLVLVGAGLLAALALAEGAVRLHHFAMQVGSLEELFEIRAYLRERGVPIVYEGRRALGCHARAPENCTGVASQSTCSRHTFVWTRGTAR